MSAIETKQAKVCRPIPHARGEIVLIAYLGDGTVAEVATRDGDGFTLHLFTHSDRDGATYIDETQHYSAAEGIHLSGWAEKARTAPVWIADGTPVKRWLREGPPRGEYGNRKSIYTPVRTAADLARLGMHRIDAPLALDPFGDAEGPDGIDLEHCQFCGPMRSDYDNLCRHVFDAGDGMEGPGEDSYREPCAVPAGFKRLVRRLGCARHLLKHLTVGEFPELSTFGSMLGPTSVSTTFAGKRFDEAFDRISSDPGEHEDDYQQGFLWMSSMDEKTTGFNGSAVTWLREEIAAQDARRASGEAVYGVRSSGRGWGRGTLRAKRRPFAEARAIAERLRAKGERDVRIVRQVPKLAPQSEAPTATAESGR